MADMQFQKPISRFIKAKVAVLNDNNQFICLCGKPMQEVSRGLITCAEKKCKIEFDFNAMCEWYKSKVIEGKKLILPICRTCSAMTIYAPLTKEVGQLMPLMRCQCKQGRLPYTYYPVDQMPELYEAFNLSNCPIDTRPRKGETTAAKVPAFDLSSLEEV